MSTRRCRGALHVLVSGLGHLTCPVCGAPREPGVARCAYCGSWLAVFGGASDEQVDEPVLQEHIARFREALAHDPDDVVALHGTGVALRTLGLYDDAIRVLARAANRRPESLAIQRALAGTLRDAVRSDPADQRIWRDVRRQANRMLALDPDAADGWRLRAEVALRTGDDAELISLAPKLATYDREESHRAVARRFRELGVHWYRDWQWERAVDAWAALAAIDPRAGRGVLVAFLMDNVRLIPRSTGAVWRASRRTMSLEGAFRQSTLASLVLGIAIGMTLAIGAWWFGWSALLLVVVLSIAVVPVLVVVLVRTWLVGWPPFVRDRAPWTSVSTDDMVGVARRIAPEIARIRPRA